MIKTYLKLSAKSKYLIFSVFLTSTFILQPLSFLRAEASYSTKVSFQTGEKSQTDNIEERDLSGNYKFYKYSITTKAKLKDSSRFSASYYNYQKNFLNNKLDARINNYNGSFFIPLRENNVFTLSNKLNYELLTKRYKDNDTGEYDRNSIYNEIKLEYNNIYSIEAAAGLTDYEYIKYSAANLLKTFLKLAPEIKISDDITVSGYYKRLLADTPSNNKDYSEDTLSIRPVMKLACPYFYKIRTHFEQGRCDTRDTKEDREDSLRFKYKLWDITGYFKPHEKLKTELTYGQKNRDYIISLNDYNNWFINLENDYELIKNNHFGLHLITTGEHKETDFNRNNILSYIKNSYSMRLNIIQKEDWSVKPSLQITNYNYPSGSTSDQTSYQLSLPIIKYLRSENDILEAEYYYKWKDYQDKPNDEQWALNLSYNIKF